MGSGGDEGEVRVCGCRIIFSLEGVGEECTKEQVEVLFDGWSV